LKRPNILILHTDQQRWDTLGVNGNPDIKTPHLDRMAAEGVNFDHHFVQNPVCMPSRVSFLTGQYCRTLGITHMAVPVPEDALTLPRMLHNYGYTSANIGKLHFLPHSNRDHREVHPDYGFDHLEISDEPGCYDDAYYAWVEQKAPDQLDKISLGLPPVTERWYQLMGIKDRIKHPKERCPRKALAFRSRSDLTHTAFVAEQTINFIRNHSDKQPFFCMAGFYSPHSPWVAPQEFLDLYDPSALPVPEFPPEMDAKRSADSFSDDELRSVRHGYYAMISEVDHHVGRILGCLEELGLARDTIVVFTSDHGEWLGEHLLYGKGYPAADCISRVPLVIRWPNGIANPGKVVHNIVEAIDVVPTLLAAAAIPRPEHLQGEVLLAANGQSPAPDGEVAITEYTGWKALRAPGFRYIAEADGKESLFDIEKDPGDYHNVAAEPEYAPVLARMRHLLVKRLVESERPIPRTWPY